MRIAIIQDYLRLGGTETQSAFLANAFAAQGHAALLLTFRPGGALRARIQKTVTTATLQPLDTRLNFWAPRLLYSLNQYKPDVVLCMGREANRRCPRIARACPVIATARSGKRITAADKAAWQASCAVISNSHWAKERLAAEGIAPEKIHVLPNAFTRDWERDTLPALREKERSQLRSGTTVFLSVAAFRKGKGQERLIEFFAGMSHEDNWQLWFVGDGERRKTAERKAHQLGLGQRVRFMGAADPLPFLAAADVFVSASMTESLPNALVEAQWAGLPVIALQTGGVGETFADKESGFLIEARANGAEKAFRQKATQLMQEAALRENMGTASTHFFDTQFSGEASVTRHLEILRSACA